MQQNASRLQSYFSLHEPVTDLILYSVYTDKKKKIIFLTCKEIQMGSGAKSYMRKGFLIGIYEEMRKYLTLGYDESVNHGFAPDPL